MSMYKTSFPTISLTGHIHSIFHKKTISVGKFLKKVWKNLHLSNRLYNFAPMSEEPIG